jgi:hypothetical protein
MVKNPINLAIRLLLEILALFIFALWGWKQADDWKRYLLAIGIPLFFAVLWGVFAVKNDPSRSGKTVVPTPGWVRLLLELSFFGFAVLGLFHLGKTVHAIVFAGFVIFHYFLSVHRIKWLIKQNAKNKQANS